MDEKVVKAREAFESQSATNAGDERCTSRDDKATSSSDEPSTSTETGDTNGCNEEIQRDLMTSSYTEISFGESDCEDQTDIDEHGLFSEMCDDRQSVDASGEDTRALQIARGSLSLPQLSSTIVNWSERAKAEYDAAYGESDEFSSRPITAEPNLPSGSIDYTQDGMVTFVADDLENKLRLSSPVSSRSYSMISEENIPSSSESSSISINHQFLNEIEKQTQTISENVQSIADHISKYTHNVTKLTVESITQYEKCLFQTCDEIDANIKLMYQLIAKTEELNATMAPIDSLNADIKEVKRLLDMFERALETKTF
ncbi:uncharacterized protein B4U79_04244 [Dinothrombium tinctorium]|uniref:BLOC-1-related complex subunit 6 C-terminal helix domain-containing protein n=1 Tax=Dinothrombium tinctorium TaxID=1965070 RepID=A0A3S3RJV8_9ACAR|nr:uncharacterized protein B4U79_14320 [Dinothrombium tinctorium]RWS02080.1 uncharacterized protein B4U79_04244 [Dinothrombium tinctorium]